MCGDSGTAGTIRGVCTACATGQSGLLVPLTVLSSSEWSNWHIAGDSMYTAADFLQGTQATSL
jgi:hypothetical protein